jgi:hypothetical protein
VERTIELLACVHFLIIGLSHLMQPRAWVEFFVVLRAQGNVGVFANSFLSLWFGSIIVVGHNVWSGWPIILTVIGWAQLIKAGVGFVAPAVSMRGMQRVSMERAWEFQIAGAIFLVLSGAMAYLLLR